MMLNINNVQYNHIVRNIEILESAYSQSNDNDIRISVKEQVFYELYLHIEKFDEYFWEDFKECKMSSLREIDVLSQKIYKKIEVDKLSQIEPTDLKKVIKLKTRPLNILVKGYNEAVENNNLTYYSQQIDEKFILLFPNESEIIGTVGEINKNITPKQHLCSFCKTFISYADVVFITNTIKTTNGQYSSLGHYCCKDYVKCNSNILDTENLTAFMTYNGSKKRTR